MSFTRIEISHQLTPGSRNAAISGASLSTWPASQLRPPSLVAMRWTALPAPLATTSKRFVNATRYQAGRSAGQMSTSGQFSDDRSQRVGEGGADDDIGEADLLASPLD